MTLDLTDWQDTASLAAVEFNALMRGFLAMKAGEICQPATDSMASARSHHVRCRNAGVVDFQECFYSLSENGVTRHFFRVH